MRLREASEAIRNCLLARASPGEHSILLSLAQYGDGASLASLQSYHSAWARAYAESLAPRQPQPVDERGGRALRLGFVSSDLGLHPTGFMVLPLLENLDKDSFHITCYSDRSELCRAAAERV